MKIIMQIQRPENYRRHQYAQLLSLFEKMYEDNLSGKISDDWFRQFSEKYSMEQEDNIRHISEYKKELQELKDTVSRQKKFTKKVK